MPKAAAGRGRGRPKGSKTKANVMKKVGKKGAYKKSVKNQMTMRRAPIVETKQRVHSDVAFINGFPAGAAATNIQNPLNWRTIAVDDAFTSVPLRSWHRISHGFAENQCIGNSIFSKYLNFKIQVRFPRNEMISLPDPNYPDDDTMRYNVLNKMIEQPTKLYLVCGWITESMNYPLVNDTSPSLPAQSEADGEALNTYITQQLKPFFDDDEDKLQFRPKQTTNIKIEKYVRIHPNQSKAIGSQATPALSHTQAYDGSMTANNSSQGTYNYGPNHSAGTPGNVTTTGTTSATGSMPDVFRSWSSKTNRKIPLTEGKETDFDVDKQNLFPNNSWVPFAVIYNPDYEAQVLNTIPDANDPKKFSQVQFLEYRFNDVHYYTDS